MNHIAYINKKPELSGKNSIPDGGITGNGDFSVILGNSQKGMKIHLAKCDLWNAVLHCKKGGIRPLGSIDIDIPQAMYSNYHCEQDADKAKLTCRFADKSRVLVITLTVLKSINALVIEEAGSIALPVPELKYARGDGDNGTFSWDGCPYIYRRFNSKENLYVTEAYSGMKRTGKGQWFVFAATNHDTENPLDAVKNTLAGITSEKIDELKEIHKAEWKKFWSKSSVKLSDETLENGWYQSNFLLAVCTGNKKFAPGLYGNFITVENPNWKSDYHLNYNYQAPFYAACSSNHVEFTDCYHAPLEDFAETGRKFASVFGCRGIIYPVGIQPCGYISEYQPDAENPFMRLFLGQKSNHIHAADIMIFRWYATRDTEYARLHAYPFVKECLEFFEDWLVLNKGRYSILKDAAHEVPYYRAGFDEYEERKYVNSKNPLLTLGLLRLGLSAGIDMSRELGVDADKREIWSDILEDLSDFPTYHRKMKKVFRYTEKGQAWNDGNSLGLQHIYPSGCIDLNSDKKTLKIAENSLFSTPRWNDDNASNSVYPCAVRIGVDPTFILGKLRENIDKFLLPNWLFLHYGGCLENCSLVPNVINEMALQSNNGVLRFFPVWDKSIDCEYTNLRANGAFLVSAVIKQGKPEKITVYSEKGYPLTYIDPFTGKKVTVATVPGETTEIKPCD